MTILSPNGSVATVQHQCVCCLEPHTSSLLLCETCEQFAVRIRTRYGLPIRTPALVKGQEEPDD